MNEDHQPDTRRDPAEDSPDIPAPEQGSPGGNSDDVDKETAKRTEQGEHDDPNPLAPPVNTEAGS
ncbi:hypothetical protein [Sphingobium sp. CCH11-B1]|jgi:hypothetical protein|uniref:hypothetical protein n=1 Tax=Sphingobium sp. CCH11-B1 TaxID=1768781 RepID=UPI0008333C08|nr:hypothetical protein [Sphingobium sp. CCH11-B1]MEA3388595.1 hypothetical protein [Pseudomonadota bacterium]